MAITVKASGLKCGDTNLLYLPTKARDQKSSRGGVSNRDTKRNYMKVQYLQPNPLIQLPLGELTCLLVEKNFTNGAVRETQAVSRRWKLRKVSDGFPWNASKLPAVSCGTFAGSEFGFNWLGLIWRRDPSS